MGNIYILEIGEILFAFLIFWHLRIHFYECFEYSLWKSNIPWFLISRDELPYSMNSLRYYVRETHLMHNESTV